VNRDTSTTQNGEVMAVMALVRVAVIWLGVAPGLAQ
jgi:hypothetical protein